MPNYRRNEDMLWAASSGIAYNAVLDVSFSNEDTSEPVTLTEAKDWCRIDVTDDDDLIEELITSARILCEEYSGISFINRTITASLNNSLGGIELPYGPVKTLTSIVDSENIEAEYTLRNENFKQLIEPVKSFVKVIYPAGYETLPKNLKTAVLNQLLWMYENRGDVKIASSLSDTTMLILNKVRRV